MNSKLTMMKHAAITAAVLAGISVAYAADGGSARAQAFAQQNAYWQGLSTSMPAYSPPVDRSAYPADPVPTANAFGGESRRFVAMDHELQAESTGMPAYSPPVDRSEPAADPIPKATTLGQREARFAAEERFLEQNSTP